MTILQNERRMAMNNRAFVSEDMSKMTRAASNFAGIMALLAISLVAGACATIINGSTQEVAISSQPSGAAVRIYDQVNSEVWSSTTPGSAVLNRGNGFFSGSSYRVEISKEGFQTEIVQLTSRLNGWYMGGNLLLGGLIGWLIVDPLTGAMWVLSPDSVNARLSEASVGMPALTANGLVVVLKQEIDPMLWHTAQPERVR
jgi:hypothetical protein